MPDATTLRLRRGLIQEEAEEVLAELDRLLDSRSDDALRDLAPLVHELADLLYVTYGAMLSCGVDPDAVFAEVHQANMRKAAGPVREDGKQLRQARGWQPADVLGVLREQGGALTGR